MHPFQISAEDFNPKVLFQYKSHVKPRPISHSHDFLSTHYVVSGHCMFEVDGKEYVGRVIAKGNDSFIYMDDVLYLNNKIKTENYLSSIKEKYLATPGNSGYFTHDFSLQTLTDSKTRKIPKDSYLILNDNRQNTRDSREFGLISSKQIQGVISFRISPLKKFGFIENK